MVYASYVNNAFLSVKIKLIFIIQNFDDHNHNTCLFEILVRQRSCQISEIFSSVVDMASVLYFSYCYFLKEIQFRRY